MPTTVLRRVRISRGMSTVALASTAGISRMTLWRLETGRQSTCQPRTRVGIERTLGLPFDVLVMPDTMNAAALADDGAGALTASATTPKAS